MAASSAAIDIERRANWTVIDPGGELALSCVIFLSLPLSRSLSARLGSDAAGKGGGQLLALLAGSSSGLARWLRVVGKKEKEAASESQESRNNCARSDVQNY